MPPRWRPPPSKKRADGSVRIEQTIYVERDGQRADPARQGRPDAQVDRRGVARRELGDSWTGPVHLFLHVKVKENWAEDRATSIRPSGLDFDV